jgi:hypothetical protein
MSEDRMRAHFRRAELALGQDAPSLDATLRQARREQTVRRAMFAAAAGLVIAVVGVAGYSALRLERSELTPLATPGLPTPQPAPLEPCGELRDVEIEPHHVAKFVTSFMSRRAAGSGAEACLSSFAADSYRVQTGDTYDPNAFGGAGTMCLYACGEFKVVDHRLDAEPQRVDANSYSVDVVVLLSDGRETVRMTEILAIGPGTSTDGNQQELVVRGAGTTGGLP